jgi:hypothetical protein
LSHIVSRYLATLFWVMPPQALAKAVETGEVTEVNFDA